MLFRWLTYLFLAVLGASLIGIMLIVFAALVVIPTLPSLEVLMDYRPKIPLRIYSAEGLLIGEFGEERRNFVKINETPTFLKQAILAAEDDRFYQHGGGGLYWYSASCLFQFQWRRSASRWQYDYDAGCT